MAIPLYLVIPDDMGSNIKEGSTVLNAPATDLNHWVAGVARGTGYTGLMYPRAAVGADAANLVINASDEYLATPMFVKQFVTAALAALPSGTDTKISSVVYNSGTRVLTINQTDSTTFSITIPQGSQTVDGLLKLVMASQIAGASSNDAAAATPALVAAMIAAAISAIPAGFDTKVNGFSYNTATRQLSIADNNAGTFNVILPVADNAQYGLAKLAIDTMYPAYAASNSLSATPAYVNSAITAAIAALPADKFLQGLQSYNAATNTMTLQMNDGSTVTVDMTALLNDAIATIPHATTAAVGVVRIVNAGMYPSSNDTEAATPAFVNAAIAAGAHAPAALTNVDGFIVVTPTGPQAWTLSFNAAALPTAGATQVGVVQLATSAEGPVGADETQATTPKYVEDRINALVPVATGSVTGKVQLATSAEGLQAANDTDAATPKYVDAAISAIPAATGTVQGKVALATAAEGLQSTNETDAATPAYVAGAITAASHLPATVVSGDGSIVNSGSGQGFNLQTRKATDTADGTVALAVAANYPASAAEDNTAATPAYVAAALAAQPAGLTAEAFVLGVGQASPWMALGSAGSSHDAGFAVVDAPTAFWNTQSELDFEFSTDGATQSGVGVAFAVGPAANQQGAVNQRPRGTVVVSHEHNTGPNPPRKNPVVYHVDRAVNAVQVGVGDYTHFRVRNKAVAFAQATFRVVVTHLVA